MCAYSLSDTNVIIPNLLYQLSCYNIVKVITIKFCLMMFSVSASFFDVEHWLVLLPRHLLV